MVDGFAQRLSTTLFARQAQHAGKPAVLAGLRDLQGNVLGLYLHGLLEDPAALQALFGRDGAAPVPTLDAVFDGLAAMAQTHFVPGFLQGLVAPPSDQRPS